MQGANVAGMVRSKNTVFGYQACPCALVPVSTHACHGQPKLIKLR